MGRAVIVSSKTLTKYNRMDAGFYSGNIAEDVESIRKARKALREARARLSNARARAHEKRDLYRKMVANGEVKPLERT